MSVFLNTEASAHDASPVEGFRFIGTYQEYRYTSAELSVTIDGRVYTPLEIGRRAIRLATQEDDNLTLEIILPVDSQLVQDYAFDVAPPDLQLELYRYHEGTDAGVDWAIMWKGEVTSITVGEHNAQLFVPGILSIALNTEIPNVYYQGPCNHVLYDARCKVDPNSFNQITTVASITDDTTIVVADDGFVDNFLRAGEIINTDNGERRAIVSNVSDVLTIVYPFFDISVGTNVELRAGCNHALNGDCINKFNNAINFGGFPYIPDDNPFEGEL